jgi:hypothetical protein
MYLKYYAQVRVLCTKQVSKSMYDIYSEAPMNNNIMII